MPSLAGSPVITLRGQPPLEPRTRRAAPERARPHATAAAGRWAGSAPLERSAGFAVHQLLAARPELSGPPASRQQTIAAYRSHLAARIHYAGPVLPVDLRV